MESKQLPTKHTAKKVKYVGTEKFLNMATGELVEMQVTDIAERDFNFSKVWMRNFIATLDLVGNQKTHVAFWIIDHLDKENRLIGTFRSISNEIGCSYQTVAITMKLLQQADFLRKTQSGVYMVNPDILFKGTRQNRLSLLTEYHDIDYNKPELTTTEKIATLQNSIAELQKELNLLTQQCDEDVIDAEIDPQLSFDMDGEIVERAR